MLRDVGDALGELMLLVPESTVEGNPGTTVAGVVPTVRVRPNTIGEIEAIVGWASKRGMAMAALGGRTKLGIGNPPSRLDLVLDMSAMDSMVEYYAEDLVLTAQAGATIQRLRSAVGRDSLVLPLDSRSGDRATIGGAIACADHGPRRRQYGGLRDVVLGLKVVLPDGSLANFGGRTLKNVAGYDAGKLFVGSLGSIGIIVEATVRLLPLPINEELLLVTLRSLETSHGLVARILGSPLLPSSLELMSPACVALSGLDRRLALPDGAYLMLIALEGHAAAVERQVRDLSVFCDELSSETEMIARIRASETGSPPNEVWDAFAGLREKALGGSSCVGVRCTVPLALSWDLAGGAEEHARANGVAACYAMSCGTGYLEAYAAGLPTNLRTFAAGLRADAERLGGAMSVLDGWSALGKEFDAWGGLRTDFELMQAVKHRFDPGGIMNPGRFVGGL